MSSSDIRKLVKIISNIIVVIIVALSISGLVIGYFAIIQPISKKKELVNSINSLTLEVKQLKLDQQDERDKLSGIEQQVKTTTDNKNLIDSQISDNITNHETYISTYEDRIKSFNQLEFDMMKYYFDLYSKYRYALDYPGGDFGWQELLYLDELCYDAKVPIPLILADIEYESGFYSKAKNPTSTAVGYGQFLKGSAHMVATKWLDTNYDRSNHFVLASNKRLGLKMMVEYIRQNIKSYKTPRGALSMYYGHPDKVERDKYVAVVNKKIQKYGYTLDNVMSKYEFTEPPTDIPES